MFGSPSKKEWDVLTIAVVIGLIVIALLAIAVLLVIVYALIYLFTGVAI